MIKKKWKQYFGFGSRFNDAWIEFCGFLFWLSVMIDKHIFNENQTMF